MAKKKSDATATDDAEPVLNFRVTAVKPGHSDDGSWLADYATEKEALARVAAEAKAGSRCKVERNK